MPEEQNLAPQETKNNESPSTVPAKPPIIDGRFKKLLTVPGLAIAAGVLIIVSLIVVAINNSQNPIALRQATVSNLLELVSVSPSGTQADPNQKLTLVFNYPVSAEHIQDFIKFTPNVPGLWNQGENDKTIVFTPEQPYFPGSKFRVTLLAGMPSESGKKLEADYTFNYGIRIAGNDIQFVKGYSSYRYMSFPVDKGLDIELNLGSEIKDPKAKLFKIAKPEELLNAFVYPTESPWNYEPKGTQEFYSGSGMTQIQEFGNLGQNNFIRHKVDAGLYYVAAFDGDKFIRGTWVSVTDLGVLLRQDDQNMYITAQKFSDQSQVNGADLNVYSLGGKPEALITGKLSGIWITKFEHPKRADIIMVRSGNDVAFLPLRLPSAEAEIGVYENLSDKHQIFIYTDRPIYKPGDIVKYRGLVRIDNDGLYLAPRPGTAVKLRAQGLDVTASVNLNGIFEGQYTIPQNISLYEYEGRVYTTEYLQATIDNRAGEEISYGSAYFDVIEYKKPEFAVDVTLDRGEYTKGDKLRAILKGEYFDGRPLSNTDVEYTIYARDYYETEKNVYNSSFRLNEWGGMCGGGFGFGEYYGEAIDSSTIRLDSQGRATFEFDSSKLKSYISQQLTVVTTLTAGDNKLNDAAEAIVHGGDFNIFVRNQTSAPSANAQFALAFTAETLAGQKLKNRELDYRLYRINYGTAPDYKREEVEVRTGKVSTNSEGLGLLREKAEVGIDSYIYVEISGKDGRGNKVAGTSYVFVNDPFDETRRTVLEIVSPKNNLVVGEKASLEINSPADINVFVTFERGRLYRHQWLPLKKGPNTFNFDVSSLYAPSITPTFSFFYEGKYHIEGLSLNVPAMHKLLNVTANFDKEVYKPGESAKVTLTVRDANNNTLISNVGVGVVDKAIYALRKNATPPIHSSYYFFRPRRTNATSSLSGIWHFGGDGGKGGGGGDSAAFAQDVDTLYWNPLLLTDINGQVSFEIPIGPQQTVWRMLVYASTLDETKVGQLEYDFSVRN